MKAIVVEVLCIKRRGGDCSGGSDDRICCKEDGMSKLDQFVR